MIFQLKNGSHFERGIIQQKNYLEHVKSFISVCLYFMSSYYKVDFTNIRFKTHLRDFKYEIFIDNQELTFIFMPLDDITFNHRRRQSWHGNLEYIYGWKHNVIE